MAVASAPAKLILCGEWAVLEPVGRAVVIAVNQRLAVDARPGVEWGVSRSGARCVLDPRDPEKAPAELRFLAFTLQRFFRDFPQDPIWLASLPGELTPGLGSSAAVVSAAAAAALSARLKQHSLDPEQLFAWAFEIHHQAQKGKGSGCDVAAACYGGLIDYQRVPDGLPVVAALDPASLPLLAIAHTGPKASTTSLMAQMRRRREAESVGYLQIVAELDRATADFCNGVLAADRIQALAALSAAADGLTELNRFAGGVLEPEPVSRLLTLARETGCVAKISGAGGGDCVLAFTNDPAALKRTRARWADAGYSVMNLRIEPRGATIGENAE